MVAWLITASLFHYTPVGRASDSVRDPTYGKAIYFRWLNLVLSVPWSFGVQLVVFFCSGISVVLFDTLGTFRCHNTLFLSNREITDPSYVLSVICLLQ